MDNKKLTPRKTARIIISIILIFLVIFANIFAVKAMTIYAVELMAYEKLSVAYDIGGLNGLRFELKRVISHPGFKRELRAAEEFGVRLDSLKDPREYLNGVISEKKKQAILLNKMRRLAMVLIFALLGARLLLNIVRKS